MLMQEVEREDDFGYKRHMLQWNGVLYTKYGDKRHMPYVELGLHTEYQLKECDKNERSREVEEQTNRGCPSSTKLLNNRNNSLAEEKTGLLIFM